MNNIQKTIDKGKCEDISYAFRNDYIFTPDQLKFLLEQVAKEQVIETISEVWLQIDYDTDEAERIKKMVLERRLVTDNLTFNEEDYVL